MSTSTFIDVNRIKAWVFSGTAVGGRVVQYGMKLCRLRFTDGFGDVRLLSWF